MDGLRIWTKTSKGIWLFRGGYTKSLSPASHTTRTCVLSGVVSPCISGSCHGAITTNSAVQLYALSLVLYALSMHVESDISSKICAHSALEQSSAPKLLASGAQVISEERGSRSHRACQVRKVLRGVLRGNTEC